MWRQKLNQNSNLLVSNNLSMVMVNFFFYWFSWTGWRESVGIVEVKNSSLRGKGWTEHSIGPLFSNDIYDAIEHQGPLSLGLHSSQSGVVEWWTRNGKTKIQSSGQPWSSRSGSAPHSYAVSQAYLKIKVDPMYANELHGGSMRCNNNKNNNNNNYYKFLTWCSIGTGYFQRKYQVITHHWLLSVHTYD